MFFFPTGHLCVCVCVCVCVYWPERAGGHLQCGWGQTCSRRFDPRWRTWRPDETASPPPCRCRAWEPARWATGRNPERHETAETMRIAVIMRRETRPWWRRLGTAAGVKVRLFSGVCVRWLLESKQIGDVEMLPEDKVYLMSRGLRRLVNECSSDLFNLEGGTALLFTIRGVFPSPLFSLLNCIMWMIGAHTIQSASLL